RGADLRRPGVRRHAADIAFNAGPGLAAVAGHVHAAVVGCSPDQAALERARGDRGDGGVVLGRADVEGESAGLVLLLPLRVVGGEIGTDDRPGLAAVVRA